MNTENNNTIDLSDAKRIGEISIDSGQVLIGDPCYVLHNKTKQYEKVLGKNWMEFLKIRAQNQKDASEGLQHQVFVDERTNATLGVLSQTKNGDGVCPVYSIGDKGIYIDLSEPEYFYDEDTGDYYTL